MLCKDDVDHKTKTIAKACKQKFMNITLPTIVIKQNKQKENSATHSANKTKLRISRQLQAPPPSSRKNFRFH